MNRANFSADLLRGQKGESAFHSLYPHLTRLSGRDADFIDETTGETYEIKSDYYDSPNFFMERWSDVDKAKPGGPWQSAQKSITYYVYLFLKQGELYIFSVLDLIKQLEDIKNPNARLIQNRSWTTMGYIVPKKELNAKVEVDLDAD